MFMLFSAQLTRLGGPNFNQIPINRPLVQPQNYQRDGFHQQFIPGYKLNYQPNRESVKGHMPRPGNGGELVGVAGPTNPAAFQSSRQAMEGIKERVKAPKFLERFNQARLFYNSQTAVEKAHMLSAYSFELSRCDDVGVRERMVLLINEVDHALACQVAANIGVAAPGQPKVENDGRTSKFLSMAAGSPYSPPISCATRKIAMPVADGYNASEMLSLKFALEKEGALLVPIGVRKGMIYAAGESVPPASQRSSVDPTNAKPDPTGKSVIAPFTLDNCKSVLFDGLALIGGEQHVATLSKIGSAHVFAAEQLKHCKAVCASGAGVKLLQSPATIAGISISGADGALVVDDGVVSGGADESATKSDFTKAFIAALKMHRAWDRKGVEAIPA
jgi:catalase